MKNYFPLILPAFALLALGGCATSSGLVTSTENDGVYYSSKDKTTMTASAQQALAYNSAYNSATDQQYLRQQPYGQQQQQPQQPATGDANPEYDDTNATTGRVSSAEYYDDGYNYAANLRRFSQASPYYGNYGTGYYGMAYTDPFYYGGGYSPYGMGFGSPFSPFGYGYGSGLSIGLGFGLGSFYSPYGYGYSPYGLGFGSPFYGGYGGYGLGNGYYGSPYGYGGYGSYGGYGYSGGGYGNSYGYGSSDRYNNSVRSGPRHDRSSEAMSAARQPTLQGGRLGGNSMIATPNGSGNVVPNDGTSNGNVYNRSRGRVISADQQMQQQQMQQQLGVPADQPNVSSNGRGGRWRLFNNNAQQPAQGQTLDQSTAPAPASRRGRLFSADQMQQQQQQQVSRPQRTYEQPSRSFEQPSRSFSSPSSSPSFSAPSGGGGGGRGRVR